MERPIRNALILFFLALEASTAAKGWTNPRSLDQEWENYGIGDPFVMRFNGLYYLYPSTRDDLVGVKVWSSPDLVEWTYRGLCTTEPITKGAYAPEVKYLNGVFHMATSPAGRGHYVLTSTSPTGPFTLPANSVNQGRSIDGSMFADDDGSLWFSHAGDPGILVNSMGSPLALDGKDVPSGASLAGWTEGPSIFKRNGLHYMTYTGNHLFSHGYRVAYAISRSGPAGPYVPAPNNPILVSTEGGFYGLGHSSNFVGPDLDTWYTAYHNLHQPKSPWRHFNIDPMAWDGEELSVLGPTDWEQPAPARADFEDRFDRDEIGSAWTNEGGGRWGIHGRSLMWQDSLGASRWHRQISSARTGADFTAEINLKEMRRGGDEARLGAVFSWTDADNFGQVAIRSSDNRIETELVKDGRPMGSIRASLPAGFDPRAWHCLRIEKKGDSLRIFVDDLLRISRGASGLAGGSLGPATFDDHADFGYIAFSDKVDGSGAASVAKPVPGRLAAVHGRNPGKARRLPFPEGGSFLSGIGPQAGLEWTINARTAGAHTVAIRYAAASSTTARFRIDGVGSQSVDLPATGGAGVFRSRVFEGLALPQGIHTLALDALQGSIDLRDLWIERGGAPPPAFLESFAGGYAAGWNHVDGIWSIADGQAVAAGFGKRLAGDPRWTDYAVEADVEVPKDGNSGLLLRASHPANGGADDDPRSGTDFVQGYYAGIQVGRVVLGLENYGWKELGNAPLQAAAGQLVHLKVVAEGDRLRVYVDDTARAVIDVVDGPVRFHGRAGLRSFVGPSRFDNFRITPRNPPAVASVSRDGRPKPPGPAVVLSLAGRIHASGRGDAAAIRFRDLSGRPVDRPSQATGLFVVQPALPAPTPGSAR